MSFHEQGRICGRLFVAAEGTNQANGDKSSDNGAERTSALSRTGITEASMKSHRIRTNGSSEAQGRPVNPKITNATLFVTGSSVPQFLMELTYISPERRECLEKQFPCIPRRSRIFPLAIRRIDKGVLPRKSDYYRGTANPTWAK